MFLLWLLLGISSLIKLTAIAAVRNMYQRVRQFFGREEKPTTPRNLAFLEDYCQTSSLFQICTAIKSQKGIYIHF